MFRTVACFVFTTQPGAFNEWISSVCSEYDRKRWRKTSYFHINFGYFVRMAIMKPLLTTISDPMACGTAKVEIAGPEPHHPLVWQMTCRCRQCRISIFRDDSQSDLCYCRRLIAHKYDTSAVYELHFSHRSANRLFQPSVFCTIFPLSIETSEQRIPGIIVGRSSLLFRWRAFV